MLHAQSIARLGDDQSMMVGKVESIIKPINGRVDHAHARIDEGTEHVRAELMDAANRFQMLEQMLAARDSWIERIQDILESLTTTAATAQGPQSSDLSPPSHGVFAACGSPRVLFGQAPQPPEAARRRTRR